MERDFYRSLTPEEREILRSKLVSAEQRIEIALNIIASGGTTDGAHHKQWALDTAARILCGNEENYNNWREQFLEHDDGDVYDHWDEGT